MARAVNKKDFFKAELSKDKIGDFSALLCDTNLDSKGESLDSSLDSKK